MITGSLSIRSLKYTTVLIQILSVICNSGSIEETFYHEDIHHEGHRHLIFASPLKVSFLNKSKIWFIDGTFKVVREAFAASKSHYYLQLCHIERPQITRLSWGAIMELLPSEITVEDIVIDIELALWSALKSLPDVPVFGCWFHWAQAVYNRVKEYGLRSAYVHQLPVRNYIRDLMALVHSVWCIHAMLH